MGSTAFKSIDPLINSLNDKKIEVRWRAVEALSKISPEDPKVISVLKSLIHDKSDLVASVALEVLDKISES